MRIELPQVGESVIEGDIGRWLKQVGERVDKYEPLVEVFTDKVNMEVPSPVAGVLTSILVKEGETVTMGTVIAEIEVDGGEPEVVDEEVVQRPAPATAPETLDRIGTMDWDAAPVGPTGSGGVISAAPESVEPSQRRRYSPAVQRLAQEHGIDLELVGGTGIGGRVSLNDVRGYVTRQAAEQPEAPERRPPPAGKPGKVVSGDVEILPLTRVRRLIAENMSRSATQIPEAWTVVEVDVTGLVLRRESLKPEFWLQEGVNLTYLAFVLRAVSRSLRGHLLLNSMWGDDSIRVNQRINLGIAVAAPQGLTVPVIHDADTRTVAELARAIDKLSRKAHEGKLTLGEVRGGTFTVNNTGALGSVVSKPIINYPEAAILTTEAAVRRPVVVGDGIAIRSMMNLCLTFDHRILDGAEVGAFLADVKRQLEGIGSETGVY